MKQCQNGVRLCSLNNFCIVLFLLLYTSLLLHKEHSISNRNMKKDFPLPKQTDTLKNNKLDYNKTKIGAFQSPNIQHDTIRQGNVRNIQQSDQRIQNVAGIQHKQISMKKGFNDLMNKPKHQSINIDTKNSKNKSLEINTSRTKNIQENQQDKNNSVQEEGMFIRKKQQGKFKQQLEKIGNQNYKMEIKLQVTPNKSVISNIQESRVSISSSRIAIFNKQASKKIMEQQKQEMRDIEFKVKKLKKSKKAQLKKLLYENNHLRESIANSSVNNDNQECIIDKNTKHELELNEQKRRFPTTPQSQLLNPDQDPQQNILFSSAKTGQQVRQNFQKQLEQLNTLKIQNKKLAEQLSGQTKARIIFANHINQMQKLLQQIQTKNDIKIRQFVQTNFSLGEEVDRLKQLQRRYLQQISVKDARIVEIQGRLAEERKIRGILERENQGYVREIQAKKLDIVALNQEIRQIQGIIQKLAVIQQENKQKKLIEQDIPFPTTPIKNKQGSFNWQLQEQGLLKNHKQQSIQFKQSPSQQVMKQISPKHLGSQDPNNDNQKAEQPQLQQNLQQCQQQQQQQQITEYLKQNQELKRSTQLLSSQLQQIRDELKKVQEQRKKIKESNEQLSLKFLNLTDENNKISSLHEMFNKQNEHLKKKLSQNMQLAKQLQAQKAKLQHESQQSKQEVQKNYTQLLKITEQQKSRQLSQKLDQLRQNYQKTIESLQNEKKQQQIYIQQLESSNRSLKDLNQSYEQMLTKRQEQIEQMGRKIGELAQREAVIVGLTDRNGLLEVERDQLAQRTKRYEEEIQVQNTYIGDLNAEIMKIRFIQSQKQRQYNDDKNQHITKQLQYQKNLNSLQTQTQQIQTKLQQQLINIVKLSNQLKSKDSQLQYLQNKNKQKSQQYQQNLQIKQDQISNLQKIVQQKQKIVLKLQQKCKQYEDQNQMGKQDQVQCRQQYCRQLEQIQQKHREQLQNLQYKLSQKQQQLTTKNQQLATKQQQIAQLTQQKHKNQQKVLSVYRQWYGIIQQMQNKLQVIEETINENQGQLNEVIQQFEQYEQQNQYLKQELIQEKQECEKIRILCLQKQSQFQELQDEYNKILAKNKELQAFFSQGNSNQSLKSYISVLENKLNQKDKQLKQKEKQLIDSKLNCEHLVEEAVGVQIQIHQLKNQVRQFNRMNNKTSQQFLKAISQKTALEQRIVAFNKQISQNHKKINELNTQIQNKGNKIVQLQNLLKQLQESLSKNNDLFQKLQVQNKKMVQHNINTQLQLETVRQKLDSLSKAYSSLQQQISTKSIQLSQSLLKNNKLSQENELKHQKIQQLEQQVFDLGIPKQIPAQPQIKILQIQNMEKDISLEKFTEQLDEHCEAKIKQYNQEIFDIFKGFVLELVKIDLIKNKKAYLEIVYNFCSTLCEYTQQRFNKLKKLMEEGDKFKVIVNKNPPEQGVKTPQISSSPITLQKAQQKRPDRTLKVSKSLDIHFDQYVQEDSLSQKLEKKKESLILSQEMDDAFSHEDEQDNYRYKKQGDSIKQSGRSSQGSKDDEGSSRISGSFAKSTHSMQEQLQAQQDIKKQMRNLRNKAKHTRRKL